MTLTLEQQRIVEENLPLVGKVIKERVHGLNRYPNTSYDDLFQIGCIGLMKAAATDKGGNFSTYAYRLIWHELCDALEKTSHCCQNEVPYSLEMLSQDAEDQIASSLHSTDIKLLIQQAASSASGVTAKGIRCLQLSLDGYTSAELGKLYQADPNTIRVWMSKARKYLRSQPAIQICAREASLCL